MSKFEHVELHGYCMQISHHIHQKVITTAACKHENSMSHSENVVFMTAMRMMGALVLCEYFKY